MKRTLLRNALLMVQHQPSIAILKTMQPLVHVKQVVSAKLLNVGLVITFQAHQLVMSAFLTPLLHAGRSIVKQLLIVLQKITQLLVIVQKKVSVKLINAPSAISSLLQENAK